MYIEKGRGENARSLRDFVVEETGAYNNEVLNKIKAHLHNLWTFSWAVKANEVMEWTAVSEQTQKKKTKKNSGKNETRAVAGTSSRVYGNKLLRWKDVKYNSEQHFTRNMRLLRVFIISVKTDWWWLCPGGIKKIIYLEKKDAISSNSKKKMVLEHIMAFLPKIYPKPCRGA